MSDTFLCNSKSTLNQAKYCITRIFLGFVDRFLSLDKSDMFENVCEVGYLLVWTDGQLDDQDAYGRSYYYDCHNV